ncbi:hypothetical protein E4K10_00580 [Streptomyces sp. T1317-0309]|nr:hypothetical protein E4K10_00580 [Streptomyces sp. T1317-0309]
MTAFFAFDSRVQSLTQQGALDLLTERLGSDAPAVYRQYATKLPHGTPAEVFTALHTDALFRNDALRIADHHAANGNGTYVYQFDYRPAGDPTIWAPPLRGSALPLHDVRQLPGQPDAGEPGDGQRALGLASPRQSRRSSPPAPRVTGLRTRLGPTQGSGTSAEASRLPGVWDNPRTRPPATEVGAPPMGRRLVQRPGTR